MKILIYILSLIPLKVGYLITDIIIFPLLYHLIGYRKKLVRKNLRESFPEKSEQELRDIERGFYHFLCDYFVETIHLASMSRDEMLMRMRFEGLEAIDHSIAQGRSVAVYLGHYCNWEWMSSYPMSLAKDNNADCLQIYHPLQNAAADEWFLGIRQRFGAKCVKMAETLRYLVKAKKDNKPTITGFIADQVPIWESIHHWMTFLNHEETPVLTGAEKIAKKLDMNVYYLDCERIKRGYYKCTLRLITQSPQDYNDFDITEKYFSLMEATIRRQPQFWLWSHNRWKRTKEEYAKRFDINTGKKKSHPDL